MSDELRTLALELKDFLVTKQRATDITGPEPLTPDWRSWEIHFTHKGLKRHYIYRIQRQDSYAQMYRALSADTNGELMVRVPHDDLAGLHTNDIYYPPHG